MAKSPNDLKAVSGLEPVLQAHLGQKLREMFNELTAEPVPDRFKTLLEKLEAQSEGDTEKSSAIEEHGSVSAKGAQ